MSCNWDQGQPKAFGLFNKFFSLCILSYLEQSLEVKCIALNAVEASTAFMLDGAIVVFSPVGRCRASY